MPGRSAREAPSVAAPAATPAGLGADAKYCPLCPGWYRVADIAATAADGTRTTWDKVILRVQVRPPEHRQSRWFGGKNRRGPETEGARTRAERAAIVAKSYTLTCPHDHELSNSTEPTDVVGVIGNVNSSKSHFLAGLVYELVYEQSLHALNIDVAYVGDGAQAMDQRINTIYTKNEVLPNTERGQVDGPYSYRLTRRPGAFDEQRSVLTFFDVAGEDCVTLATSAALVRYLFEARGIILLVDPGGLPSAGRPHVARGDASLTTRAVVDNLAESLETVSGISARLQSQVVCIALAKSDSVELPKGVYPPVVLADGDERISREVLRSRLKDYSTTCRSALMELGGKGLISAAETRFDPRRVFYSAVSATNQIPIDNSWYQPRPGGCSLPLAQILAFGDGV